MKKGFFLSMALITCLSTFAQVNKHSTLYSSNESIMAEELKSPLENKIEIYPNPSVEFIIVEIQNSLLTNVEFQLHSLIGNTVDVPYEEVGQGKYKINLFGYSPGYYFVIIKDDDQHFKEAYKFLKN